MTMKSRALLLLRISLGLFLVIWGLDKLVNVEHGLTVSEKFYMGAFNSALLLKAFGVVQVAAGIAIVLGVARRIAYPLLLAVTATTLLAVWRSIIDPLGWYLKGGNSIFYPSLIIFAAAIVLWAFRDEDRLALDARTRTGTV